MNISRNEIKQFDRFTYLGSVVEQKSEIQNEINERIRMASQFCHLITSIIWNKDIESVKPQYTRCTLRRYYYVQQRHGHALRERKGKYKQLR
jgi:hypothetical protein